VTERRSILFAELTREDLGGLARHALAIVPLGATEQHGPHLPTGTDFFHAEWVARAAARQVAGRIPLVVTPTLLFGSSEHHVPFGATISIPTTTYYDVVVAVIESLIRDGFRRIFLVNGHGGNHELVQLAARDVALSRPVAVAAASWWNAAWDVLVAEGAHEVGRLPGHAGAFETSLVLAMAPDLVREPRPHRDESGSTDPRRLFPLVREERHGFWQSIDGYTDSPDLGTAELGDRYLEASAAELGRLFVAFFEAPLPGVGS
jgi:creatinine amidohydrolase